MVLEIMNKLFEIFSKYRMIILISLLFVFILLAISQLYDFYFRYNITAKFAESGPLYKNMPVYYKGYKIGQAKKITLSPDYKYTFVKIMLYPKKPKLSKDVVAKVKNHNVRKEYIELINPDEASSKLLKNGSTIDGEAAFDIEAFLSDIADSGLLIPLIQTFSDTLVSAGKTSTEIKNFFSDSRLILKENRKNIKQTTKDLTLSTKSLRKITTKFNNSITEDKLNNTTSSVDKSSTNILAASENIKKITESIDNATKNIDKTMEKVDCTVSEANEITSNVKVITNGFCQVLGKRFAGLRIIFGKPLNKNKCAKNCSK